MESRVRMNTLYSNLFIFDTVSPRRGHIIDRDSQFKVVLSTNPDLKLRGIPSSPPPPYVEILPQITIVCCPNSVIALFSTATLGLPANMTVYT